MMKWNEILVKLRENKSIAEVAEAVNSSPDTYMAYERGEREPKQLVKKGIAEYFNVDQSYIWPI